MGIKAPFKGGDSDFEPTPAGNHIARLYAVVHIGVLDDTWQGQEKQIDKVRLTFELPNETKVFKEGDEPKPQVISEIYTLSMGKKSNLRPIVEGIVGTALLDHEAEYFDVTELVGMACMLNVVHVKKGDKTYANIHSTAPLPKGVEAPPAFNKPMVLDYEENWSEEKFTSLPEWIQEKMKSSHNYREKFNTAPESRGDGDGDINPEDIPF